MENSKIQTLGLFNPVEELTKKAKRVTERNCGKTMCLQLQVSDKAGTYAVVLRNTTADVTEKFNFASIGFDELTDTVRLIYSVNPIGEKPYKIGNRSPKTLCFYSKSVVDYLAKKAGKELSEADGIVFNITENKSVFENYFVTDIISIR